DRDDRRGDLRHRLLGGLRRRKLRLLLHHPLDVLDDDDGIVDHDTDGEYHGEQRHRIGRIAHGEQHGDGADQADGHRDRREEGGGMMVARRLARNRKTWMTTRTIASPSVCSTSRMVSRMKVVESCTTWYFSSCGKRADSRVSVAWTALAVVTALAPGAR